MSVTVNIPSYVIETYRREAMEKIRADLARLESQNITQEGLLSNRAVSWNLDYIKACSTHSDDEGDTLFPLMVRNRELEDLQKTAEAVVSILEEQNFTISDALLFLKHIESLVLASPVKY